MATRVKRQTSDPEEIRPEGTESLDITDAGRKHGLESRIMLMMLVVWLGTITPVYLSGLGIASFPVTVLLSLVTTTLAQVIGLFVIATRYVFSESSS